MNMTRTRAAFIVAGVLLILAVTVSFAVARGERHGDLSDQAVAELGDLHVPPEWGTPSVEPGEGTSSRHDSVTWRWSPHTEPAPEMQVVVFAAGQGWRPVNCGTEICLAKGEYLMQVEPASCDEATGCGLAVTVSWTAPLLAWRLLGIEVAAIGAGLAVFLMTTRTRTRTGASGSRTGTGEGP